MKKVSTCFFSEKGMTLVEILASLVLLSIIIVSCLTMFVQSSRSNSFSKNIINATYVAEASMEEVTNSVATISVTSKDSIPPTLKDLSILGYNKCLVGSCVNTCPEGYCYEKATNTNGHNLLVQLVRPYDKDIAKDPFLVKIRVKVYNNTSGSKLEAQMVNLVFLKNQSAVQ